MMDAIPKRYRDARASHLHPEIARLISSWAETKEALLILGPTGSGKTWTAAVAVRLWVRSSAEKYEADRKAAGRFSGGYYAEIRWENVPDLAREMRDWDSSAEAHARVTNCTLLVLDDLGAEKDSEFLSERIYAVVSHRYDREEPIIVTSNVSAEALNEQWPRLASRLLSGTVIELSGEDRRLEPAKMVLTAPMAEESDSRSK